MRSAGRRAYLALWAGRARAHHPPRAASLTPGLWRSWTRRAGSRRASRGRRVREWPPRLPRPAAAPASPRPRHPSAPCPPTPPTPPPPHAPPGPAHTPARQCTRSPQGRALGATLPLRRTRRSGRRRPRRSRALRLTSLGALALAPGSGLALAATRPRPSCSRRCLVCRARRWTACCRRWRTRWRCGGTRVGGKGERGRGAGQIWTAGLWSPLPTL
jgi:hypothetical protein